MPACTNLCVGLFFFLHTVRWWEVDEHSALNLLQEA